MKGIELGILLGAALGLGSCTDGVSGRVAEPGDSASVSVVLDLTSSPVPISSYRATVRCGERALHTDGAAPVVVDAGAVGCRAELETLDSSLGLLERSEDPTDWRLGEKLRFGVAPDFVQVEIVRQIPAVIAEGDRAVFRVLPEQSAPLPPAAGDDPQTGSPEGTDRTAPGTPPATVEQVFRVELLADATVNEGEPDQNYGADDRLETDEGPETDFLLKLDLRAVGSGRVSEAQLFLYCTNSSEDGGTLYEAPETEWEESQVSWSTAPVAGRELGRMGQVSSGEWIVLDLSQVVVGDGVYGFRVSNDSSDGADYASREDANRPYLLLKATGASGEGALLVPAPGSEPAVPPETPGAPPPTPGPEPTPAPASPELTRGPYLQMASSSAMTIRWRTAQSSDSVVRFGTALGALTQELVDPAPTTEHELRITGLSPETRYYYEVGSSQGALAGNDAGHSFVTFPVPGTQRRTRIWAVGDSGTANADARAVRDAYAAFASGTETDLWLMLGDNAYTDGTDEEYQAAVFETYPAMLMRSPLFPTRGNHERDTSPYYSIFTMPTAGESGGLPSGTEAYYSFDYANVHLVCLDSTGSDRSPDGPMARWLASDLAATNQDWVIAYWHHPPYTRGSHTDDVGIRDRIVPILEDYGVDLVLSGHSHSYERSYLLDGGQILDHGNGRDDQDGVYEKLSLGASPHEGGVFVVAGSSGKVSDGPLDHPLMFIGLKELGSVAIDVDGPRLDLKFVRETGAIDDYFSLVKGR